MSRRLETSIVLKEKGDITMLAVKKILFPTDFSECAEHAFSHAAELAALFDAEVHVFHTRIRPFSYYPALKHLLDEAEKTEDRQHVPHDRSAMKTLKAPLGDQVIVISAEKTGLSAYEEIINYAKEHDIDLIVMGTHGRRGPRHLFIGSTAERVVRLSECPVLTLRSDADPMTQINLNHLLVPVDFSDHSRYALKYAAELVSLWNARITLVNVIEEAILPTVYGVEPVAVFPIDNLVEQSQKALNDLKLKFFSENASNVDTQVIVGHAATSIAEFAKEVSADLIVIPTHGLTGLKRFLMGSVSEHVVRNAQCAVLTVKPFGKSLINKMANTSNDEVVA